jgi:hypothetical protein
MAEAKSTGKESNYKIRQDSYEQAKYRGKTTVPISTTKKRDSDNSNEEQDHSD